MFGPFKTAKSLTVSSSPRYIFIKAFVERIILFGSPFFKRVHHVSTGPGHENELFLPGHQILHIHCSVLHTDFISYISCNLITAAQDWQLDPSKNIWAVFFAMNGNFSETKKVQLISLSILALPIQSKYVILNCSQFETRITQETTFVICRLWIKVLDNVVQEKSKANLMSW